MSTAGRVNAVIVNYRTPDLVLKCVHSIIEHGVAAAGDIIVVENASPDDSLEKLTEPLKALNVQLLASQKNDGFGAGVNIGVSHADKPYVVVLNPDTYFEDGSFSRAIDYFEQHPETGLLGLNLVYPGGERQFSARRFYSLVDVAARRLPIGNWWPFKRLVDRHLMVKAWHSGDAFEAEWVMGTGFVVRRELFQQIEGMDEAYFLYMEDVDLCARVWRAGFSVVCLPQARLVHDHQRSSAAQPFSWAGKMHIKSLLYFRRKFCVPVFRPPGVAGILK